MSNKLRPEMASHPLTVAARSVDNYCERFGLKPTCEHYNLAIEDLTYIAEQRALRMALLFSRGKLPDANKGVQHFSLSAQELELHTQFSALAMDGLLIGWAGRQIAWEEEGGVA